MDIVLEKKKIKDYIDLKGIHADLLFNKGSIIDLIDLNSPPINNKM